MTRVSCVVQNSAAMQKLAEENAYLVAALQRYDSAVSFLKQTVAIIMTKVCISEMPWFCLSWNRGWTRGRGVPCVVVVIARSPCSAHCDLGKYCG